MSNRTCPDGLIIPALAVSTRNSIFYLAGLLYCFLGIAIAADVFMCSIERITSTTKKVKKEAKKNVLVANSTRETEFEEVRVWNPTVANLTLMALGSSAPEILLSVIEIMGNGFKSGELGPGTIVGSAAFNLFCISAICVLAVLSPGAKKIEAFKVFIVTAFFGTFAYIWLLIILQFISPDVVEIWEAALTLLFFVILIVVAYAADVEIWKNKKPHLKDELEIEMADVKKGAAPDLEGSIKRYASQLSLEPDHTGFAATPRRETAETIRQMTRDVARVYPNLTAEDQAKILAYRINRQTSHDRLYYRIKAVREMSSSWKKTSEDAEVEQLMKKAEVTEPDGRFKPRIEFSARVYAIDPSDKTCILTIVRRGPIQGSVLVNYQTVNGIAKRDLHFLAKSESIRFGPGERSRDIQIQLVEGADWRPNHVFYVHLKIEDQEEGDRTKLGSCSVARVRFPDDTASLMAEPTIEFVKSNYIVSENAGWARLFVSRRGKIRKGRCSLTYETQDVTAQASFDYIPVQNGKLTFDNHEYEKYIDIEIIDDKMDEKDETFYVELLSTSDSNITLGSRRKTTVTIISDDNVIKNITNVHKLMGHYLKQMTPGQASWREQIINASSVNAGDIANATICDCLLHALAFPWKFTLAFVPPPNIFGGWLCFLVALAVIGFITAIVGDFASIFGCMVGLKDSVTAITLVALGTSLPDTFASKIAAQNDDNADNAVGNVTGSNSVNVFLGLGMPWLIASIYWAIKGETFVVKAGDLGFSVAVFMCCSIIFLVVLFLRRSLSFFGKAELGGPSLPKFASGFFFILLWFGYVALSIWNTYRQ